MRKTGIIGILVAWLLASGIAYAGDVVVVAHPDLPMDHLSAADVKKIFLGGKEFVGDTKVHAVQFSRESDVSAQFFHAVLGLTPSAFRSFWIKEVFRSGRVPPAKVDSIQAMLDTVAQEQGAIGYVPAEKLEGVTGVKRVLTVHVP